MTTNQIPHNKQKIQGGEKKAMDNMFRDGVKQIFNSYTLTKAVEQEFDEIGFGNQLRIPGGKYGARRVELKDFIAKHIAAAREEGAMDERERIVSVIYDLEEPEMDDECDDPDCECNQQYKTDYENNKVRNSARFELIGKLTNLSVKEDE